MKNKATSLLSLSVIAISTLLFTTGCKKDGPSGAAAQLNATVGSTSFQPSAVTAVNELGHILIGGIQIVNGDTISLALSIPDTAKAGQKVSVSINDDDLITFGHSKTLVGYDSYEQDAHGTITVNSLDKTNKKVSGSFSAVLYDYMGSADSVKVNGQFNTTYLGL